MKQWYLNLSDATRAGINTAWQSAAGSFALMILGWLDDVKGWLDHDIEQFPAVTPLGKAAGSIAVGLVTGVLVTLYRTVKPGPHYPKA